MAKAKPTAQKAAPAPAISAEPTPAESAAPAAGRQGDQHRPACPYCSKPPAEKGGEATVVLCKAGSSGGYFTRYYCPTSGCSYSEKRPRPRALRPREQDEFAAR